MAKIMNLKDVKGQPTVILLKVTDFFPFKVWKVLYATTEKSNKTLSTPKAGRVEVRWFRARPRKEPAEKGAGVGQVSFGTEGAL